MNTDDKDKIDVEAWDEVWTLQAGNAAAQDIVDRLNEDRKK